MQYGCTDIAQKEPALLAAFPPTPIKSENYSRNPLPPHTAATVTPRYDLRVSVLPRHVRLLIGEELFHEHDAPPV